MISTNTLREIVAEMFGLDVEADRRKVNRRLEGQLTGAYFYKTRRRTLRDKFLRLRDVLQCARDPLLLELALRRGFLRDVLNYARSRPLLAELAVKGLHPRKRCSECRGDIAGGPAILVELPIVGEGRSVRHVCSEQCRDALEVRTALADEGDEHA